jgi:hypothetical protein
MKPIHQLIRISLLFLFISASAYSTNYYLDLNASGQNNGSSWADAWESFSAINWSIIGGGDTLFISGGALNDSTVYYGTMTIGASGEVGNPIVITPGNDTGHNGKVVFDMTSYGNRNISISSRSNITINGQDRMAFWHGGGGSQGQIHATGYTNIIIEHCYFNEPYGNGNIRAQGGTNIIIRYNIMHMGGSGPEGTRADNIVLAYSVHGVWIDHNQIIGDNGYGSCEGGRHCDNIQVFGGQNSDIVVSNNFMYDFDGDPTKPGGCHQMLMWEDCAEGEYVLYNNVFYMPNKDGGNTILDKDQAFGPKTYYVIHNTMVSGTNANQLNLHSANFYVYNNIFQATSGPNSNHGLYPGNGGGASWVNVQNNMFGDNHSTSWTNTSLSTVQSWGAETGNTIFYDDVELVYGQDKPDVFPDQDFHLQSTSPAINAGIFDLGGQTLQEFVEGLDVGGYGYQLVWEDMDGNPRGSSPDIGAYEFDNGPDLTPPTVVGASLQDSVTLVVNFSELLDATTAEDENNYSISNNISVFNASLSGSHVTLQTSPHSFDSYVVTVVNVEDLAGNPIAQNNTANYERIFIPPDSTIKFPVQNVEGVIQEPNHTPEKTIDGLGALDGDPDSRWAAEPMPEELIFDLGAIRMVSKTRLSFYNWNNGRVYNYSISVSNDHSNWNTIVPQATSASNEEWTIDQFSPVDARYIRVHFNNNNQSDWAGLWEGEIWGLDLPVSVETTLPEEFLLYQNYPNPFNPSTKISWQSPTSGRQTLKIYDVLGNEKATLVDEYKQAGSYEIEWNASDLPSGIYFYQLKTESFIETKKMTLLK